MCEANTCYFRVTHLRAVSRFKEQFCACWMRKFQHCEAPRRGGRDSAIAARINRNVLLDVDLILTSTRRWPLVCACRCQRGHGSPLCCKAHWCWSPGPDSNCTLMPQEEWCETELDSIDWQLLLTIGNCLLITADRFRALLNAALRNSFRTDCALTRISTSRHVGGGKGQKYSTHPSLQRRNWWSLDSMDAMSVLIVRRLVPSITLRSMSARNGLLRSLSRALTSRVGHCVWWWPRAQLHFDHLGTWPLWI